MDITRKKIFVNFDMILLKVIYNSIQEINITCLTIYSLNEYHDTDIHNWVKTHISYIQYVPTFRYYDIHKMTFEYADIYICMYNLTLDENTINFINFEN